jgi:hypothetical protein
VASLAVRSSTERYWQRSSGSIGLSAVPETGCFQPVTGVFLRHRPPCSSEYGFILSWARRPLQRRVHLSPVRRSRAPDTPPRVSFPFATSAPGVHFALGVPCPTMFRPQRFARSRRFAPPRAFVGLFHPTATSGILTPGVSSCCPADSPLDASSPLAVSLRPPTAERTRQRQSTKARLQGFDPDSSPQ